MKTSKVIATISYNSVDFLKVKLHELIKQGDIDFYAFIQHKKENDNNKNHIHLFMVPAKTIDTLKLRDNFNELDLHNPVPLGCMTIQKSDFGNWYWYCLHDVNYLASKGLTRKYHYKTSDFITSDQERFNELVNDNKYQNKQQYIIELLSQGVSPLELLKMGLIGFNQLRSVQETKQLIIESNESKIQDQELSNIITDNSKCQPIQETINLWEDFKI